MVTLDNAKEVTRKLVSRLPLKAVIVFGSVARKGKGNDLDLLVVWEDDGMTKKKHSGLICRVIYCDKCFFGEIHRANRDRYFAKETGTQEGQYQPAKPGTVQDTSPFTKGIKSELQRNCLHA